MRSLFLFTILFFCSCQKRQLSLPPSEIPVVTARAIKKTVPLYLETVGHMEPYQVVNIMTQASGTLVKTHFKNGADIQKGELLYSIDPRPYLADLELAEGRLQENLAKLGYAQRSAKRNAPLVKDEYISEDQFDNLETTVVADDANVQQSLALVERAKINLDYTKIYSPIDARAGFSLVNDGNLLLKQDRTTLVTLNQISPIYATFFLPGKEFSTIRYYETKNPSLSVFAIPDTKHPLSYRGTLHFTNNQIDLETGMIELKAIFPNKEKILWPNQYVRIQLILDTIEDAILLPVEAVQRSGKKTFVFLVRENQTVVSQPVVLGQRHGKYLLIEKGIYENDQVVVDGQLNLYDGAKVSIKKQALMEEHAPF